MSDFQTAWAVVASKVMSRSSDLILKGIISLLSIVPLVLGTTADDMVNPSRLLFLVFKRFALCFLKHILLLY